MQASTIRLRLTGWRACLATALVPALVIAATAVLGQSPTGLAPGTHAGDEAVPAGADSTPPGLPTAALPTLRVAEPASRVGAAGEMIGFFHPDGAGSQTITLVHTGKSWIAVYHIDRSGTVRLVSSRPIAADFSLQLNATSPLPEEIRRLESASR